MTPFLLTIANLGDDLSRSFIQEALQNVKVLQIATPKNPDKPSIPKQKKEIFGKKSEIKNKDLLNTLPEGIFKRLIQITVLRNLGLLV